MVLNATFRNISAISWRYVLFVEKTIELQQVTDKLYLDRWFAQNWNPDVSFTVHPVTLISSCLIRLFIKDCDS